MYVSVIYCLLFPIPPPTTHLSPPPLHSSPSFPSNLFTPSFYSLPTTLVSLSVHLYLPSTFLSFPAFHLVIHILFTILYSILIYFSPLSLNSLLQSLVVFKGLHCFGFCLLMVHWSSIHSLTHGHSITVINYLIIIIFNKWTAIISYLIITIVIMIMFN